MAEEKPAQTPSPPQQQPQAPAPAPNPGVVIGTESFHGQITTKNNDQSGQKSAATKTK